MSNELTSQQSKILEYMKLYLREKRYPPSVREICQAVGLKSTSTVHSHLTKLESKGYIKRDQTKPRAIEILGEEFDYDLNSASNVIPFESRSNQDVKTGYIPIVGRVTAGEPILATENIEESFPVPLEFVNDGDYFMLRVKGDSMIEAGIFDRDFVMIRQQNHAKNGDYVVAMIDDSATVKTFYKEKDHIRLQPENPALSPILVKDVDILGIVKGVFRKM